MKHHLSHSDKVKGGHESHEPMKDHHGHISDHLKKEHSRHAHHIEHAKKMHHMPHKKEQ